MSVDAHVAMSYRYNGSGRKRNSKLCLRICIACCYAYDSPLALKQAEVAKRSSSVGRAKEPDRVCFACLFLCRSPLSSSLIQHEVVSQLFIAPKWSAGLRVSTGRTEEDGVWH